MFGLPIKTRSGPLGPNFSPKLDLKVQYIGKKLLGMFVTKMDFCALVLQRNILLLPTVIALALIPYNPWNPWILIQC